jgi:plasmid stabilization system protein ParE
VKVRIHPEVEVELGFAAEWLWKQGSKHAVRFLEDYEATVSRIEEDPELNPLMESVPAELNVRRRKLESFSYLVIYRIFETEALILAVAHTSRRPNYWMSRLQED